MQPFPPRTQPSSSFSSPSSAAESLPSPPPTPDSPSFRLPRFLPPCPSHIRPVKVEELNLPEVMDDLKDVPDLFLRDMLAYLAPRLLAGVEALTVLPPPTSSTSSPFPSLSSPLPPLLPCVFSPSSSPNALLDGPPIPPTHLLALTFSPSPSTPSTTPFAPAPLERVLLPIHALPWALTSGVIARALAACPYKAESRSSVVEEEEKTTTKAPQPPAGSIWASPAAALGASAPPPPPSDLSPFTFNPPPPLPSPSHTAPLPPAPSVAAPVSTAGTESSPATATATPVTAEEQHLRTAQSLFGFRPQPAFPPSLSPSPTPSPAPPPPFPPPSALHPHPPHLVRLHLRLPVLHLPLVLPSRDAFVEGLNRAWVYGGDGGEGEVWGYLMGEGDDEGEEGVEGGELGDCKEKERERAARVVGMWKTLVALEVADGVPSDGDGEEEEEMGEGGEDDLMAAAYEGVGGTGELWDVLRAAWGEVVRGLTGESSGCEETEEEEGEGSEWSKGEEEGEEEDELEGMED